MAWLLLFLVSFVLVAVLFRVRHQSVEVGVLKAENARLWGSVALQEDDSARQQRDLRSSQSALDGLQTDLKAATQQSERHQAEFDQIRQSLLQLDATLQGGDPPEPLAYADVQSIARRIGDLTSNLSRYAGLSEPEQHIAKLTEQRSALEDQTSRLESRRQELAENIQNLDQQLNNLQLDEYAQQFGLYEPKYDLGESQKHKQTLDDLRIQQKVLIKAKQAIRCDLTWRTNDSLTEGRRMIRQLMQLMLYAFNGEVEALITKVRFDNVERIATRIQTLFVKINALHGGTQTYITAEYLELKLHELYLVYEYKEQKQAEAEEQRAIREQMRDEELAQRELDRALEAAKREARRYEIALEKAREEIEQAFGERQGALQREIDRLSSLLEEANANERSIAQAQLTKRGHVYVISNIGSFGKDIYKIGMTRRLEPLERVRELSNASVPFNFDVHAVIYTDDAPALELAMHQQFASKRLNQVNIRKEFFRLPLEEIQRFVHQHHGRIEFTLAAEAHDYRLSQQLDRAPAS